MRSSEVKNFESHVKSLADLNTALGGVGIKSVHVGKLGHVKFTLRYQDENGVDHKASFSRRELVRFATQLAKDQEYKNLADDFKEFQENYNKLVGRIDRKLSKKTHKKAVKLGRTVASFVKVFHNPEKKIRIASEKIRLNDIPQPPKIKPPPHPKETKPRATRPISEHMDDTQATESEGPKTKASSQELKKKLNNRKYNDWRTAHRKPRPEAAGTVDMGTTGDLGTMVIKSDSTKSQESE